MLLKTIIKFYIQTIYWSNFSVFSWINLRTELYIREDPTVGHIFVWADSRHLDMSLFELYLFLYLFLFLFHSQLILIQLSLCSRLSSTCPTLPIYPHQVRPLIIHPLINRPPFQSALSLPHVLLPPCTSGGWVGTERSTWYILHIQRGQHQEAATELLRQYLHYISDQS